MKVDGTFDIECAEWTRFVVAATWEPSHGTKIHRSRSALVDYLLRRSGLTWHAHASGQYDGLAVVEEMRERGIPCSVDLAGSRASRIVGGGIVLRDSWPLVPLPLAKAVELIGERQMELDSNLFPCLCGQDDCGGFCQLVRALRSARHMKHVSERCASDARQLYSLLRRIDEIGAALDLDLCGTIGGTAWATAMRKLGLPKASHSSVEWRAIRKAYFGGRVTIIRPVADEGSHFDMSSAYGSALATVGMPSGKPVALAGAEARRALESNSSGVFSAVVTVPDMFIPPLPVRQPRRIVYPIGHIRGTWTGIELRAAMNRGVKIDAINWAMVWPTAGIRFHSLMREWWDARRKAGKGTALGAWLRLLPSSLSGKLAENPHKRAASIYPKTIRFCEGRPPCVLATMKRRGRCTGVCGAYEQLDQWGQIWSVPIFRPSPCSHIEWAAHLTSGARIRLQEAMETAGERGVYYDTDSSWTTIGVPPGRIGDGLGDWEHKCDFAPSDERDDEGNWNRIPGFVCTAPRQYSYQPVDGKRAVKTAGIAISAQEYGRGFAKNDRGVLSFVEAAAASRGLFVRRNQNWNVSGRGTGEGLYGDRRIDTTTGLTYPLRFGHGDQKDCEA